MKNYRVCNDDIFEFSKQHDAYIFFGKLMGKPLKKRVKEIYDAMYQADMERKQKGETE